MPHDLLQVQREQEGVSSSHDITSDSLHLDVVSVKTGWTTFVQRITLSIAVHEAGAVVLIGSHDGAGPRAFASHTDRAAGAGVPSVVSWDFGLYGTPCDADSHVAILVTPTGVPTLVGTVTVEGYRKRTGTSSL